LLSAGFNSGSQWIDGSFVENVETVRRRAPRDIDVITLFHRPLAYQVDPHKWTDTYEREIFPNYFDTKKMKPTYRCDTYAIDLDAASTSLIRNSTYWFGLFSDMRGSNEKKGIVEISLPTDPMEFSAIDQIIRRHFDV